MKSSEIFLRAFLFAKDSVKNFLAEKEKTTKPDMKNAKDAVPFVQKGSVPPGMLYEK